MANYFNLTLDTTGPANPSIFIESGATYTTQQLVDCTIGTTDGDTTGYQMKIWGDVDTAYDVNIQDIETTSSWITFAGAKQIQLAAGNGEKYLYLKIRDDVYNESGQGSDSIILNTTLPAVSITGPDAAKISKITGKNVCSFSFRADCIFDEYKVKVVAGFGSVHDTGTLIPTSGGSINMSGADGGYPAATPINCTIYGTDLETVSSGDGVKLIKLFVKDESGQWSV
ncbi:MAG: hypothetical protein ACOWWO_11910 [Peptococcaceae bacterium]